MSKHRTAMPEVQPALFDTGRNCWRVATASRVAFLVDGDAYFTALVQAARQAQRSILITGWDFHSRTRLLRDGNAGRDLELGEFLNELARTHRGLHIHVLIWDYPTICGMDREWAPIYGLGWRPHRRVHFRFDNALPAGAAHHQKIVVIDDAVAFSGGIDLTVRRWDTGAHAADNALRVSQGTAYAPFHALMMAVEGEVARALGDLVRERWRLVTGETLQPVGTSRRSQRRPSSASAVRASRWPDATPVDLENVQVAISRTAPAVDGRTGVREVQAMYVDMIAAARRCIYIENQYFTADVVGHALEQRLREADGPQIFVVLRRLSHGWLEELTMETLRNHMIARLKAADAHDRLRVVYPHIEGLQDGTCIDVNSGVIIVDEDIARIGSASIANRSMGLDTECDLTLEAAGRDDIRAAIRALRARLLAEHLGSTPQQVEEIIAQTGSLHAVLVHLRQDQRTLHLLEDAPQESADLLNRISVTDPERSVGLADLAKILSADDAAAATQPRTGPAWGKLTALALVIGGLAALWQVTPLSELFDARRVMAWAREFGGNWWAPLVTMLAYTPAVLTMFPRSPITLFAVVAFGPVMGFVYAMLGLQCSAWVTYVVGQQLDRDTVRRMAGSRLNEVIQVLRHRGLIAVTALRLVPLAPFSVEGIVAGAVGIRRWHFQVGTAIGLIPGTLAATIFGHQIEAALDDTARINYWLLGAAVLVMVIATWLVRRWVLNAAAQLRPSPTAQSDRESTAASGHRVGRAVV